MVDESSLLMPAAPPRSSLCAEVCTYDVRHAAADSHYLLFVVAMWIVDRLQCAPVTGDVEAAQQSSRSWDERSRWLVRCNPLYWLPWSGAFSCKLLGRWAIRLASCNRKPSLLAIRDSASATSVRILILPLTGFFALAVLLTIGQILSISSNWMPEAAAGSEQPPELQRQLHGCYARLVLCVSFVAGSVAYLWGATWRDFALLRACVLGFCAFAFAVELASLIALVLLTRWHEHATFVDVLGVLFTLVFGISYMQTAFAMHQLLEELRAEDLAAAEEAAAQAAAAAAASPAQRKAAQVVTAADSGSSGGGTHTAGMYTMRAWAALSAAIIVSVAVVSLTFLSVMDDKYFFAIIG